jgi:hypothetical protein
MTNPFEPPVSRTGMNLTVNIDSVVLEGVAFGYRDRMRLHAALQTELAQLLAADGLAASLVTGGTRTAMPGGLIAAGSEADPETLGKQIAQAVYQGIGR